MTHKLDPLQYEFNSLEPYIDEQTMKLHHDKHHQTYVDKLNAALENFKDLQKLSIEELLKDLNKIPESIRTQVKNHGGGHFNHAFWWPMLKKDTKISGEIEKSIISKFGTFDKFKEEFTKSTLNVFGSGWVWLVLNNGNLEIITTQNQDSPISQGKIPILGIDVWEHAYYLRYFNKRNDYIESFFKVINWNQVNENYKKAKK